MNIYTLVPDGYFGSNCYLLEINNEWALIDPSCGIDEVSKYVSPEKIKYILITHSHFDHFLKINEFQDFKNQVCIGAEDLIGLSDAYLNCYLGFLGVHDGYYGEARALSDGDELALGGEVIKVLFTPGHTKGGVSYITPMGVFVGDTLFAKGGYGRCDLPGGDINILENSLIKLFARFRDEVFYPGHGEPSTFAQAIEYFN